MIDYEQEELLTLSQAARTLPVVRGNKTPHPITIQRWVKKGVKSASGKKIYLEATWIGGTRFTSKEALQRFFQRKQDVEYIPLPPTQEKQQKQLKQQANEALKFLQAEGLVNKSTGEFKGNQSNLAKDNLPNSSK